MIISTPFKKSLPGTCRSPRTAATIASVVLMNIAFTAPAHADTSASIAVSNMYLFRGANLTTDGSPAVSGSLDWTDESGLYGTVWTSSEGPAGSYEIDFIAGYANQVGELSYDVSLISYEYPGATGSESWGDVSEFILGVGYAGVSFSVADALHGSLANGDYYYMTLGYEMDKYSAMLGGFVSDTVTEYTHLDLSFAATEELSFTLSTIVDDSGNDGLDTDPLLSVVWGKTFDL